MDKKTNNWKTKKLGEIFNIERGGSPRPIEEYITDDENGINWIKIGDTKGVTKYITKTNEKIKPEGLKKTRMVYEDDFILSNSMSFGRPYIMKTNGCIHDGWLVIRKNENVDNNYLYYVLTSNQVYVQFSTLAKGSTVKNLNIAAVKEVEIPLPPLETQHAIVSKIEELFSELDKGIAELKTAQQQLKTYRQSVLKSAFEGKLTNENVKDGELPDGWELKNLGEVFKVSSGRGIKINQLKGGDYCVYGGNGLNGYHSEYFIEESVLIIGRVGVKCGVTHITKPKGWVSDNALIVKPIIEDFDIKFFKLRLEFENLNKLSVSTAQPVISGNSIYSVQIFLPKLEEQNRIVQEIESRLSVADKMEQSIEENLQKAEALRQSILKKAFSGELV